MNKNKHNRKSKIKEYISTFLIIILMAVLTAGIAILFGMVIYLYIT